MAVGSATDGSGLGWRVSEPAAPGTEELNADEEEDDHGGGAEADGDELVHERDPPLRPAGPALRPRIDLRHHTVQDGVRIEEVVGRIEP